MLVLIRGNLSLDYIAPYGRYAPWELDSEDSHNNLESAPPRVAMTH
jgi:hypothetical protein